MTVLYIVALVAAVSAIVAALFAWRAARLCSHLEALIKNQS